MRARFSAWALVLSLLCMAQQAHAHKASDAYLTLTMRGERVTGQWDLALRDLDRVLALDANGDGDLTWAELRQHEAMLSAHVLGALSLAVAQHTCSLDAEAIAIVEHSDSPYARLPFSADCGQAIDQLSLDYRFLFDLDAQHRAVVRIVEAEGERTLILSSTQRTAKVALAATKELSFASMIAEGVHHIMGGFDHILFLLALLLPVVLRPERERENAAAQLGAALRDVVKVVTAFTLAHSLTLGLAWFGVASVPAYIIEPAIAASVAIAALDNLRPMFGNDRWSVAFALGLLHGFGFSSALADSGLSASGMLAPLFAFNFGVELGQLAIVLVFVPLAFLLRRAWFYRFVVMRCGSFAIVMVSLMWLYERIGEG